MRQLKKAEEITKYVIEARGRGKSVGFVPTMGALHAGHISLIRQAKQQCDVTVASIFLNPTQFGPQEDFDHYPRDLEGDLELLSSYNTDVAFTPATEEMYGEGFQTWVAPGRLSGMWEGKVRPGHFRGVTTVVLKLFNIVRPDVAYFGQKDFQQFIVIRRMVEDLNLGIRLVMCPVQRDGDGLALSSRNVYLSAAERKAALVLSRSLRCGEERARQGESKAKTVLGHMRLLIAEEPEFKLDYLSIVDPATLAPADRISAGCVALAAGRVNQIHLIDNLIFGPPGSSPDLLLQLALSGPVVTSREARIPGIETDALLMRIESCRECAAMTSVQLPPREFLAKYIKRDYPDLNSVRIAVIGRCSSIRPENFLYRNEGRENRFAQGLFKLVGAENFADFKRRFVLTDCLRCHYSGPHIPEKAMRNCLDHLKDELELFPHLDTLVALGDDAYVAVQRLLLGREDGDFAPFGEFLNQRGWAKQKARVAALGGKDLRIFYCHHPTFGYLRSPSIAAQLEA